MADDAAGTPAQPQIKLVAPLEEIDDWDPDREVRRAGGGG